MLKPSKPLEHALTVINRAMNYAGVKYWLCFGGLWGLIMNDGVIPDGDLDICCKYGSDFRRIKKAFESSPGQYTMTHAMVSDIDRDMALHCGYSSSRGLPHICLSFWYQWEDLVFYCHDDAHEVSGQGAPSSYHFKGMPSKAIGILRMVEWPGIVQSTKVSVPRFPGVVLDNLYPDWAYRKQKYQINKRNEVNKERSVSYHYGGARSRYAVRVSSMGDFGSERTIRSELSKSDKAMNILLKTRV